ncbi:AAA family ATPase [Uliginosibacterium flavum]|uniref:AAA family ATPase n=1 Tax=Uliginosibacterium flavum TaxID=1396831 RepID=A0ABV2THQ8_9RHOO
MTIEASLAMQRKIVEALHDPRRYPHPVSNFTLIETHISFVLLTGEFAYKIKKAVDLGFVDYTTLAQRRFCCEEELRLNRRLASQLYLEVVALGGSPDNPHLAAEDWAIEYAVKMRQFEQTDLLDQVLARNSLLAGHIDKLAAMLGAFHRNAPACAADQSYGSAALIRSQLEALLPPFEPPTDARDRDYGALEVWCRKEYARLYEVFALRKSCGFVREGHGDLHLGNMVLLDREVLIFDCIEFNPALRWVDIASDIAFLSMDLAAHGRSDFAWRLLNAWLETTGDYAALELLRFYQAYRALVRTKVASLRLADPALSSDARHAAKASHAAYMNYACTLTNPGARAVIITHGLSGSGKSTLARSIAASLGALCLRSDVERKRLRRLPSMAHDGSNVGTGLYAESVTQATYDRLLALASTVLAADYPVVVDATFLRRPQRERFAELARTVGVPFMILDCHAPRGVLQQRIAARAERGGDASDADLAVLDWQISHAETLGQDEQAATVTIDTLMKDHGGSTAAVREHLRPNLP